MGMILKPQISHWGNICVEFSAPFPIATTRRASSVPNSTASTPHGATTRRSTPPPTKSTASSSARRRGVASSLLEAVDAHARRESLEKVLLHVEDDNDAAIAFYEAQAFARVKVDKDLRQFGTALGLNPDIHYLFSRSVS